MALFAIDQVSLTPGVPDRSRTDGLATGAVVTLTATATGTTYRFRLLWVPAYDTTAVASLAVTGDPKIWTFTPTVGARGTYRIELIVDEGLSTESRVVRTLKVRTIGGLAIPALNERADPTANLINAGAAQIQRSEDNADDYNVSGLPTRYAGWWRGLQELFFWAVTSIQEPPIGRRTILTNDGGPDGGNSSLYTAPGTAVSIPDAVGTVTTTDTTPTFIPAVPNNGSPAFVRYPDVDGTIKVGVLVKATESGVVVVYKEFAVVDQIQATGTDPTLLLRLVDGADPIDPNANGIDYRAAGYAISNGVEVQTDYDEGLQIRVIGPPVTTLIWTAEAQNRKDEA